MNGPGTDSRFEAVVFDLDNTLYDELAYFDQVFEEVAHTISSLTDGTQETVAEEILDEFVEKGSQYPNFFSYVAEMYGLDEAYHDRFYETYQTVDASLELYDDADRILRWLCAQGYALGIITNGTARAQRNKISALGIENRFDAICVARERGAEKPSTEPYEWITNELSVEGPDCVYVGDNPMSDFQGADACGFTTVRLRRGEFAELTRNKEHIDHEIDTHDRLKELV